MTTLTFDLWLLTYGPQCCVNYPDDRSCWKAEGTLTDLSWERENHLVRRYFSPNDKWMEEREWNMDELDHGRRERERVTMEDGNGDIKSERQTHRDRGTGGKCRKKTNFQSQRESWLKPKRVYRGEYTGIQRGRPHWASKTLSW